MIINHFQQNHSYNLNTTEEKKLIELSQKFGNKV